MVSSVVGMFVVPIAVVGWIGLVGYDTYKVITVDEADPSLVRGQGSDDPTEARGKSGLVVEATNPKKVGAVV